MIEKSDQVDIYGSGMNYHIACEFSYMLSRIDKRVNVPESTNTRINQALLSDKTHVAVVLSHTGNTKQYEELLHILRKKETKIIILTGYLSSKLAQLSDYKIYVMPGRKFSDMGPMFFSESTKYVLNILFALLFTKNYRMNVDRSSEYAKMANYEKEIKDTI
ncbi:SIS domain-containing protein [Erwinia sp. CPCC 100877]|nr:SIS domain-containing protein [Erwinia sp. CPCC 100877]